MACASPTVTPHTVNNSISSVCTKTEAIRHRANKLSVANLPLRQKRSSASNNSNASSAQSNRGQSNEKIGRQSTDAETVSASWNTSRDSVEYRLYSAVLPALDVCTLR